MGNGVGGPNSNKKESTLSQGKIRSSFLLDSPFLIEDKIR